MRIKERLFMDGTTVIKLDRTKRQSNTGHTGIHYIATSNTHQVSIGSRILGWCARLDDAVALRAEGMRRIADGTFNDWYTTLKAGRRKYGRK